LNTDSDTNRQDLRSTLGVYAVPSGRPRRPADPALRHVVGEGRERSSGGPAGGAGGISSPDRTTARAPS
jgi:hypothetical protein